MAVTRLTRAALVVVSLLGAGGALAEPLTYTGQVAHVSDADTVRVVVRDTCAEAACPSVGESLRVRLAEIDAPESDQPYGDEAAAALVDRIDGSMLQIVQTDTDQYGRVVAQLVHQDVWINGWLVGEGHAWVRPSCSSGSPRPARRSGACGRPMIRWSPGCGVVSDVLPHPAQRRVFYGHPAVGRGGLYRFATEPRRPFVPHSRRVSALRVTIPCPSGRSRGLRAPLARLWGEAPRCFPALRASVSPAALAACALRLRRPWGAAPHPVLAGRQPRPVSCGRSAPWFPGAGAPGGWAPSGPSRGRVLARPSLRAAPTP